MGPVARASLVVRADAHPPMGSGHLVRSFALAQGWIDAGGDALLVTSAEILPADVARGDVPLQRLAERHPSPRDAETVTALLAERPGAWVACDGYHFDAPYLEAIGRAGGRTVLVDDTAHRPGIRADVLLNQNLDASDLPYTAETSPCKLLGPRYALLRRSFRRWSTWRRSVRPRADRVLVTMGGSDPYGQAARVVRALRSRADRALEVAVLVGASHSGAELVTDGAAPVRTRSYVDPPDVPGLMAWADIAVSAGGTTCWELCLMGLPMILMTVAENQAIVTGGLAKRGAAVHLGRPDEATDDTIAATVLGLLDDVARREEISARGRAIVDGLGAMRVSRVLRGDPE